MREGNFNRVERAERVEKGLGVSSQELVSGEVIVHAKSAKFAKSDVGNVLTQRHKGTESWPMVRLGDVCVISRGRVMSKQYLAKHQGQYPVYSSQTKNDGVFGYIDTYDFDGEYLTWTTDGANAGSVFYHNGKFSVTNVCGLLRVVNDSVWTKWLLYCLRFCAKSYVNKSLGNPKLMSNVVSRIEIKVPPISVQKEIVERLEKELGEADKVTAEFKRMSELADKEFKAELDETFGGLGEKESGVSSQELGLAAKNAKSAKPWPMVRLGDVCEFRRGLTYAKADEVSYSSKVVLRSNNVDLESGELNLNDLKYLREDFEVPVEKIIEPNTLLMCIANGSKSHLGKVALIEQDFKYAFGGFMGLLVPRNINSKYLYYFLSAPLFKAYVKSLQDGANINNLKFSDFSEFQIPHLPIEVQKGIVAKLDAAKERCEKLKAEAERGLRAAENLRKAILSEAFEL